MMMYITTLIYVCGSRRWWGPLAGHILVHTTPPQMPSTGQSETLDVSLHCDLLHTHVAACDGRDTCWQRSQVSTEEV